MEKARKRNGNGEEQQKFEFIELYSYIAPQSKRLYCGRWLVRLSVDTGFTGNSFWYTP
jgi:hypothetical protein